MPAQVRADDHAKHPVFSRRYQLLLLLLLIGTAWFWAEYKYYFIAKRFGTVVPGKIYRSGQLSATVIKRTLMRHQIRVIVDLTAVDATNPFQQTEARVAKELHIQHCRFPLRGDGTGDIHQYVDAVVAIRKATRESKPVLVHCGAGAQRTGGVVAVYRLLIEGRPIDEVVQEMTRYGWDPADDAALPDYLNRHMAQLVRWLVYCGVIERMPAELPTFNVSQ